MNAIHRGFSTNLIFDYANATNSKCMYNINKQTMYLPSLFIGLCVAVVKTQLVFHIDTDLSVTSTHLSI